ncbi:MAG: redoxin domain-containing protein [Planctomycetaceae bacterium]|nr:redoxin domain-containing protein [Planctomycetaceae bacterium]
MTERNSSTRVSRYLTWTCLLAFLATLFSAPDYGNFVAADDAAPEAPAENPFPGRIPAPSLDGGVEWYNTTDPISLKELRGKIVLLDFWTYCCINCMHVLPDLKYLEQKYKNELVVIGVHAPKFDNEKSGENIREAILRYEIEHPVVNDANMTIARKYQFNSWPTFVLIDPEGNYVGRQPGEGNRELFDDVIERMIAWHKAKGTLDSTPVRFDLERQKAEQTPLRYPGKLLTDVPGKRLFISDSNNNRIVVTGLNGELQTVIGSGQIGRRDGSYEEATFDHPQGMSLVGNTLYVADTENHLLRTVDLEKKQVGTLAGMGYQARHRFALGNVGLPSGGPLQEVPLNSPWDVYHLNGTLYVAMAGPHQLWYHKLGSKGIEVFAGSGREDIIDGNYEDAALAQPSGITSDGKDLFHVDSEGSAIRQVTLGDKGMVTTLVGPHDLPRGRSLFEFADIDGVGDEARLQHPIGLVYHNGTIFVADTYNHKIKSIDVKTRECTTWLGTGQRGTRLDPVELSEPAGLAVAGDTLYVADTNNHRVLTVDLKSKATKVLTVEGLTPPAAPQVQETNEVSDDTPLVELAETKVAGNKVDVTVAFDLPEDFKLNQLAPVGIRLTGDKDQQVVAPNALGGKKRATSDGKTATFSIPLNGTAGSTTIEVVLTYQYCKDGKGGVCRFATQRWTLPLVVAEGGTGALNLTAKP